MRSNTSIALALLLTGCSEPPPLESTPPAPAERVVLPDPLPPPPVPQDPAAGRSGLDGLTWMFGATGREGRPRLIYSARGSDELAVNLQCDPGGSEVRVLVIRTAIPGPLPAAWPYVLSSGPEHATI